MGNAVLNTQLAHVSAAEMQHRIQIDPGMLVTAAAAGTGATAAPATAGTAPIAVTAGSPENADALEQDVWAAGGVTCLRW